MLRLFPHSWGKPWLLGLAHERFLGWIGARDLENQEFLVMLTILRTETWILAVLLLFMEQVIFIAISWISIKDIEHEWRLFVRLCICMNWQQKIVERIDLGFILDLERRAEWLTPSRYVGVGLQSDVHSPLLVKICDADFLFLPSGSFGHFQASKSGVHKGGLNKPLVKAGFVATRISVRLIFCLSPLILCQIREYQTFIYTYSVGWLDAQLACKVE